MSSAPSSFAAVLFDLDETLNDRVASWKAFCPVLIAEFAPRLTPVEVDTVLELILKADHGGYRPKAEFFGELCDGLPWSDRPSVAELETLWRSRFAACIVARPGVKELLGDIRSAGLRVGVVTNGTAQLQRAKVVRLGLDSLIDVLVFSEEAGVKKPDRKIFEIGLQGVRCPAEQVLFVGDNPLLDIEGAAKLGMRTVWLKLRRTWPEELAPPTFQIKSLSELRSLLGLAR